MLTYMQPSHRSLIKNTTGFLMKGQDHLLFQLASQIPVGGTIVEVGPFLGKSTIAMALGAAEKNPKIYAIDTFKGNSIDFKNGTNNVHWVGDSYLDQFMSNLKKANISFVEPVKGNSIDVGANWDKGIDFLFLDGSFDFETVKKDYEQFGLWVKPGGLIALHHVAPQWEGRFKLWNCCVKHDLDKNKHFFSIAYGVKKNEKNLHIIIPVFNRIEHTLECLKSIYQSTIIDECSVHIVDDGSTDGTAEKVRQNYPEVNVIEGDGTLYWTGAVNRALEIIKQSLNENGHFCLINNDVRISSETLEVLRDNLKTLGPNAAVAPLAYNGVDAESAGWGPGTGEILNDFSVQTRHFHYNKFLEVHAIFGRCSIFPNGILDYVSNFDSDVFPHYHGDTDFCLRARAKGFKFYVDSSTQIVVAVNHKTTGGHLAFRQNPQSWKNVWRNMTSITSIDNIRYYYRFKNRHDPKNKYRALFHKIWDSISNWNPFFKLRSFKRASSK